MDTQRGIFIHCMGGWRAAFCVLDNLVPHRKLPREPDDPEDMSSSTEGRRGFGWVCRLHDYVGDVGVLADGTDMPWTKVLKREFWLQMREATLVLDREPTDGELDRLAETELEAFVIKGPTAPTTAQVVLKAKTLSAAVETAARAFGSVGITVKEQLPRSREELERLADY